MISYAQLQTFIERYAPRLLFLLGAIIGYFTGLPDEKLFMSVIATIGALLSSLTGIAISSFLSLKTEIAEVLKKRGFYKILMKYGNISLLLSLSLTLIGVFGFLIPEHYEIFYGSLVIGMILSACGAFYRIFWLLLKVGSFYKT